MRSTKPQFYAYEEDIFELAEILNKLESLLHEERPLAFVNNTWDQELFTQVAIPPDDAYAKKPQSSRFSNKKGYAWKAYIGYSSTDGNHGDQGSF